MATRGSRVRIKAPSQWRIEMEPIYFGAQGIAKGRRFWYFSTTHWWLHNRSPLENQREGYLFKLDYRSHKIRAHRKMPFKELGYDHIGDLDYLNGLIYASLEDVDYARPRIVVFKDDDLSVEGYSDLVGQSHLPWCAMNPANKLVYSSEFDPVTHINVFKLKNRGSADLVDKLRLNRNLHNVQGGSIHVNKLYLSCDDEVKGIYEVDLASGEVSTLLETRIPREMEGLFVDSSDGIVIHFIDHEGYLYHARQRSVA